MRIEMDVKQTLQRQPIVVRVETNVQIIRSAKTRHAVITTLNLIRTLKVLRIAVQKVSYIDIATIFGKVVGVLHTMPVSPQHPKVQKNAGQFSND